MGLGHQKRRSGRQRLPPIVWTDLVFRQPPPEGTVQVISPPFPVTPEGFQRALQGPRDAVTREKPKIRKILVDLRPVLENIMEPGDPWEGRSETRSVPSAGCSPRDGGQPGGGDRASHGGASPATETAGVTSLPPVVAQPRDSGQVAGTPEPRAPRDGALARRAAPRREPTPPVSFPKIIAQREPADQPPPERSHSAERPAPSPDVQLPTRLLLQRLQETTTSENHQLIAQALQSLRKELQGEAPASPSEGERWRLLWEPPRRRKDHAGRKNRKATGLDPAARERRSGQLPWKAGSPVAGNTREAACPQIHR